MTVRKLAISIVLFSIMASEASFAAGRLQYRAKEYYPPAPIAPLTENRVQLDLGPMISSGLGVSYERTVSPQITVGPYASFFKLDPKDKTPSSVLSTFSAKSTVTQYGLRGRYFFTEANVSSFYGLAGVNYASASTEASFSGTTPDQAKVNTFGGLGGFGYQWILGSLTEGTSTLINLAGTYGTGSAIQTLGRSNGRTTKIEESKIQSGLALELNLGFMF